MTDEVTHVVEIPVVEPILVVEPTTEAVVDHQQVPSAQDSLNADQK